jgi:hypothetical protein
MGELLENGLGMHHSGDIAGPISTPTAPRFVSRRGAVGPSGWRLREVQETRLLLRRRVSSPETALWIAAEWTFVENGNLAENKGFWPTSLS